jgi:hypothetical protein
MAFSGPSQGNRSGAPEVAHDVPDSATRNAAEDDAHKIFLTICFMGAPSRLPSDCMYADSLADQRGLVQEPPKATRTSLASPGGLNHIRRGFRGRLPRS